MNRKWMVGMVVPLLLIPMCGCQKQTPKKPPDTNAQTTTALAPPAVDEKEHSAPDGDMQVVNDELRRRGFSPDVHFDHDESTLTDDTRLKLSRNADLLKSQPQFSVTIEGYCDSRDALALGERRANAVRDYLSSLGVAANRMRTISYGKERPVCTEEAESCSSQNRRAHIVITGLVNVG